ncbi:hypothetical protein DGM98_02045 [Xanthomonas citri]|uniref:Uncharacterized protein n=1 Tax=Xanthomonas citri pv. phaseoli var. fuscans TaxID=473423 RepID=A0AB33F6Q4_XANCI|nr:hypothetical protein DGM98_02045 [Xanthomonas citri]
MQATAMRLPSLHQNEEVVSPGESDAFVQGRSCAAPLLTKAGSLRFDLIGFQGETHDGNRRPIATSFATRDPRVSTVFVTRMLMLPGQPLASHRLVAQRHVTAAAAP